MIKEYLDRNQMKIKSLGDMLRDTIVLNGSIKFPDKINQKGTEAFVRKMLLDGRQAVVNRRHDIQSYAKLKLAKGKIERPSVLSADYMESFKKHRSDLQGEKVYRDANWITVQNLCEEQKKLFDEQEARLNSSISRLRDEYRRW